MDQLEREIQQNYIYARPAPNNPYAPASTAIPRYASPTPSGYFAPGRYPSPDIRIARSDASDRSSDISDVSPYAGRGYDYATGYRDPVNYASVQPGWGQPAPSSFQRSPSASAVPQSFQRSTSGSVAPQSFQRVPSGSAVPPNFQSFPEQYFSAPPSHISPSTSRNFHSIEDPSQHLNAPAYYGSRASNTSRSSNAANAPAQPFSPSQMQLVAFNNGRAVASDYDGPPEETRYTSPTSPQWSMDATRGTSGSQRSMSAASSQGMYPAADASPLSGYSDVTRSSGYAESCDDVASYGDYREYLPDSEEEREYMSDDVASNEGEYYSSGEEPEYGGEGDDIYSDASGGYSDSYDDESYGSD
jgi:hypothetical protein